jgi:hypothetical protein
LVLFEHLYENFLAGFLGFGWVPEEHATKPLHFWMVCLIKPLKRWGLHIGTVDNLTFNDETKAHLVHRSEKRGSGNKIRRFNCLKSLAFA